MFEKVLNASLLGLVATGIDSHLHNHIFSLLKITEFKSFLILCQTIVNMITTLAVHLRLYPLILLVLQ